MWDNFPFCKLTLSINEIIACEIKILDIIQLLDYTFYSDYSVILNGPEPSRFKGLVVYRI